MNTYQRLVIVCLWCFLLASCAAPFEIPADWKQSNAIAKDFLLSDMWTLSGKEFRIQQSVIFRSRGKEVPMSGFFLLDTRAKTARAVALNEVGIKFFDIEVTESGHVTHFLFPEFKRFRGFSGLVAESIRRMYLKDQPGGGGTVYRGPENLHVVRREEGRTLLFTFDSGTHNLIRKGCIEEKWDVFYADYEPLQEVSIPRKTTYTDDRAGYELELIVHTVESQ